MAVRFTHKELSPPHSRNCRHLVRLQWTNPEDLKTGKSTIQTLVEWIDNGGIGYVGNTNTKVRTVHPAGERPYLRSEPNDTPNDNLLNLPDI